MSCCSSYIIFYGYITSVYVYCMWFDFMIVSSNIIIDLVYSYSLELVPKLPIWELGTLHAGMGMFSWSVMHDDIDLIIIKLVDLLELA